MPRQLPTPSAKRSGPALLSRIVKSLRPLENVASCQNAIAGARSGAHVAQLRDRAYGPGFLDSEAGLDGDAQVVDPDHLAGLSPAVAAAPALGVAVELAPPLGLCSPVMERDRLGLAGAHQACDHAPGGGLAGCEAALARQHGADIGAPPTAESEAAFGAPARARRRSTGAAALLAQAPLPAAGRRPGAAGRLQGGRLGRAFAAKLVEQRERVEALGGRRRKLVADRVETAEFAVRMFDLHGAFPRLSAAGFVSSATLPQKFFARPHVSEPGQSGSFPAAAQLGISDFRLQALSWPGTGGSRSRG